MADIKENGFEPAQFLVENIELLLWLWVPGGSGLSGMRFIRKRNYTLNKN